MKKNILKIVVGIIVILLIVLLIFKLDLKEKTFNQVELNDYNTIENELFPTYYDTILNVAMEQMKLKGHIVIMGQLSDATKGKFDGELKAHVRYIDPNFFLFTDKLNRREAIEVLCHEVIHMQQYSSGDLLYGDGNVTWKGETIELSSKQYENRSWENDAFNRQKQLIKSVEGILYKND
jgi:hypothetical protein